jgi:predicted ester cyclase
MRPSPVAANNVLIVDGAPAKFSACNSALRRGPKMSEENKKVVLDCWDAANRRDVAGFDRYYAEDVVFHNGEADIRGRENVKTYLLGFLTALPDIKLTVEDVFAEGDRVFSRARLQGTNTGEFNGMAPTGRRIDVSWIMNAARVQGGRIVEEWEIVDQLQIMRQLGVIDLARPSAAA